MMMSSLLFNKARLEGKSLNYQAEYLNTNGQ